MVFFAGFDSDNNTSIAFNGSYHSCSYQIILPSKKHFISLFQKKSSSYFAVNALIAFLSYRFYTAHQKEAVGQRFNKR